MAKTTEDMLNKISDKLDELQKSTHNIDKEVALQKASFENHLDHHDRMLEEYKRTNDILQANTDSLREHMHRTELLESLVADMQARITPLEKQKIQQDAVQDHKLSTLKKWGKIGAGIATGLGVLMAIKPWLIKILTGL